MKKNMSFKKILPILFIMLVGAGCGAFIGQYIKFADNTDKSSWEVLLFVLLLLIGMYAAVFFQIIVHEAGHLIFGLLTGYGFSSFRIGSLMWIRLDGKIRFRRFSLAGTGGQCLMCPPEQKNSKYPYVLYNLGGSILNLVSAGIFIGFAALSQGSKVLYVLFIIFALVGAAFALMNGIPMRLGVVDNDGYNAFSLGKTPEALRSFWIQLEVNRLIAKGVRLRDMPDEWFMMPDDESLKNSMVAVLGVFSCNRLMDQERFAEADKEMERLLALDSGIIGLHRSLLRNDQAYCELVGENRKERLDSLLDSEQKKFMKSMRKYPSILRTEYAYELLFGRDAGKAKQVMAQFDKNAESYPYANEIKGERQLMAYAEDINLTK